MSVAKPKEIKYLYIDIIKQNLLKLKVKNYTRALRVAKKLKKNAKKYLILVNIFFIKKYTILILYALHNQTASVKKIVFFKIMSWCLTVMLTVKSTCELKFCQDDLIVKIFTEGILIYLTLVSI